jgi:hypothetical protein
MSSTHGALPWTRAGVSGRSTNGRHGWAAGALNDFHPLGNQDDRRQHQSTHRPRKHRPSGAVSGHKSLLRNPPRNGPACQQTALNHRMALMAWQCHGYHHVMSCGICGGQNGTGAGLSQSFGLLANCHSAYTFTLAIIRGWYRGPTVESRPTPTKVLNSIQGYVDMQPTGRGF